MVVTQFYDLAKWLPGARSPTFSSRGAAWRWRGWSFRFLVAAFRYGPLAGGDMVFRVATTAVVDLCATFAAAGVGAGPAGGARIAAPQRAGGAGRVRAWCCCSPAGFSIDTIRPS